MIYAALYTLAIRCYAFSVRIASLFNSKAKLFIEGRVGLLQKIEEALKGEQRPRVWMHCASLGEFEQGRPVFEEMREKYPDHAFIITFFSPSGYEVRKDYSGADHVFYLPMDSDNNAKRFLDIVQPSLCLFVKYELWYYFLSNIAARKIPLLLVSANFRAEQVFFKWYGSFQRRMLRCFSHLFVQNELSVKLLNGISITNVTQSGDTRFDRVIQVAEQKTELPIAVAFAEGQKVIVAGSTWHEDEVLLKKTLKLLPEWKLILVPHEVDAPHIAEIEKLFEQDAVLWSQWQGSSAKRVLVVDKVGFLSQLYRYGSVAWIGGGFGKEGVHNVLEAAAYGMPCMYGPVFYQFVEAEELIASGGAVTIQKPDELGAKVLELEDRSKQMEIGTAARRYVLSKSGATAKVMGYIAANKLL